MGVVYEFGGFSFDLFRRHLVNEHGTEIPLPPRALDVLTLFVSRPGELVEKPVLMTQLWPDTTVGDNSLDQVISRLRRALASLGNPALITTERGRGYRFVADVITRVSADPGDPAGVDHAEAKGDSRDSYAQDLYLQARTLSVRPSPDNLRAACELLQAAITHDSEFALALAHLALIRTVLLAFDIPAKPWSTVTDLNTDALANAEREARAALASYPRLARAHQALGNICVARGDWCEAADNYEKASELEADPDARVTRIWQLRHSAGHLLKALREAEQLDPVTASQPLGSMALATTALLLDRDEVARSYAEQASVFGWPSANPVLQDIRFQLAVRAGHFREAAAVVALDSGKSHDGETDAANQLCAALDGSAARDEAVASIRLFATRLRRDTFGTTDRRRAVLWLTMLGALDEAFDVANESLNHYRCRSVIGTGWGFLWLREMAVFRRDPRFTSFASRLRLPEYWHRHGPPDEPVPGCLY